MQPLLEGQSLAAGFMLRAIRHPLQLMGVTPCDVHVQVSRHRSQHGDEVGQLFWQDHGCS
jgi:hypothetical protein